MVGVTSRLLILVLLVLLMPSVVSGETITFDEMLPSNSNCCYLATEYADLGVSFETTDDGSIWAGLSNGNPGAWFLEGTNGPAFLGFNGTSFSARMLFDDVVTGFSLDMAPSVGWYDASDVFTLEGYLGGVLVDRVSVPPLEFGLWMTVELVGDIDEVFMISEGPSFPNTYGIDNVSWEVAAARPGPEPDPVPEPGDEQDPPAPDEPEVMQIEIDIKPGNARNVVNLFSRGVTKVAILGGEDFDVDTIDPETLAMGPGMASVVKRARMKDRNRDGLADLVVRFKTRELGLAFGDDEICLSGMTDEGVAFEGCDSIHDPFRHRGRHGASKKRGQSVRNR